MRRVVKSSAVAVLVALLDLALAPTFSWGQGGQSALMPPNANFRGKSFVEWNVLALEWEIATGLGEQDLPAAVKDVHFLPGNFVGDEFDIKLKPGTAIAFPLWPVYGELYDDGSQDNPNDPIIALLPHISVIDARLDGKVLFQGLVSDYPQYEFGPIMLDQPIFYAEPQPRGPGLNAVAATFVLGLGSVINPLPTGKHTLVVDVHNAILGDYHTTYHITVSPK